MAEVLVRYLASVTGKDDVTWVPQACGAMAGDGLWEGWIEFVSPDNAIRTPRETEQPNRDDLMYWAQGLTAAYIQGALVRATAPRRVVPKEPAVPARFDGPAHPPSARPFAPQRAVLDPFATFGQGEDLLRGQLAALSRDNLVTIVEDYRLDVKDARTLETGVLIDAIVAAVRAVTRAA
jgi:hypothetical protein